MTPQEASHAMGINAALVIVLLAAIVGVAGVFGWR